MNLNEIKTAAQEAAQEIFDLYWKDKEFPVDPIQIARDLGIQIDFISLSANTAGGIWSKKNYPPVMFINSTDHINRQRFTCAHELGHYYLRQGDDQFEYTDYRDNLSSEGTDPIEVFSNNFAASLLMPQSEILRLKNENKSEIYMAKHFCVSPEAIHYRLKNLENA